MCGIVGLFQAGGMAANEGAVLAPLSAARVLSAAALIRRAVLRVSNGR